jgi:hypothetical protein
MLKQPDEIFHAEPVPHPPTGEDYRELADMLRDVARDTRLRVPRSELLRLAANYKLRADFLDERTYIWP